MKFDTGVDFDLNLPSLPLKVHDLKWWRKTTWLQPMAFICLTLGCRVIQPYVVQCYSSPFVQFDLIVDQNILSVKLNSLNILYVSYLLKRLLSNMRFRLRFWSELTILACPTNWSIRGWLGILIWHFIKKMILWNS